MKRKLNKVFLVIIGIITLIIINATILIASSDYEIVVIGGQSVSHYNTGGYVYMPTTYVVDSAEMRGAWVTTVWNEDMPKQKDATEKSIKEYQDTYLEILDTLEKYNMNTIFFQIRPANDAFYISEYNDWSKYLVGAGVDPGWDPMAWMIEKAHERNIYFMGWMNAFRVTPEEWFEDDAINHTEAELIAKKAEAIASLTSKNFARQHPECVVMGDYDSKLFLNPGDPVVHEHIVRSLEEIARNYDIDGFHFDDYFYPSARHADMNPQITNLCFAGGVSYSANLTGVNLMNDLPTYQNYQADPDYYDLEPGLALGEFRRQSVNNLMRKIRTMVDSVNAELGKEIEYGSKPAAVWQSNYEYCHDSRTAVGGSNTHCGAYSSNYDLFADTKYWVENGLVDWVAPQVYYDFSNSVVPYADIVSWWANIVRKTNENRALEGKKPIKMYVAHGIYKYHKSDTEYNDVNEMVYQVRYNKLFPEIKGDAVYAYNDLVIFRNTIQRQGIGVNLYVLWRTNPVLPLPKATVDSTTLTIDSLTLRETANNNTYRVITPKRSDISMYCVYRFAKGVTPDFTDTTKRINIIKSYSFNNNVDFNLVMTDAYDYYLQPVSNNYYPSTNATKIDLANLEPNHAPSNVQISINGDPDSFNAKDILNITIPYATDADGDELTYDVSISLTGKNGSFTYHCDSLEYESDHIAATFEPFGSYIEEFVLKVEVSDGITKTVSYYGPISLGSEASPNPPSGGDGDTPSTPGTKGCPFGSYLLPGVAFLGLAFVFIKRKEQ